MNKLSKLLLKIILISQLIKHADSSLCTSQAKQKYTPLIDQYPDQKDELSAMTNFPIPVWYSDRDLTSINQVDSALKSCNEDISTIIVYGLPNKDCEAKESSPGSNKNTEDYTNFINALHDKVNNKNVVYILEPDALSLSMPEKCGLDNNYLENIKIALSILSQNINAKIYLDIGYWLLIYGDDKIKTIIDIVNNIDSYNIIRGFSLNLSNYRSTDENINSCNKLREMSNKDYKCIIDTSRNNNGPGNTWCNLKSAGIGVIPTNNTGSNFIDYFMWIKPAIEVDGGCANMQDSFQGNFVPGDINIDYFKLLWNQGILKKNKTKYLDVENKIFRCRKL